MIRNELYDLWLNLIVPYYQSADKAGELFEEIFNTYSEKSRHYHNCDHLKDLLQLSVEYGHRLENVEVVRFSIFYHDIIYKRSRRDNEARSADLARTRLRELNVFEDQIELVTQFILATKNHQPVPIKFEKDLFYFLDFDLGILGSDEKTYDRYAKGIRIEYRQFPDFLYKPGRQKVIKHYLEKPFIYHSDDFKERFEEQARKNLDAELKSLQ
jgi:predicted metal-dependent HD superfamily phosphohydrolase